MSISDVVIIAGFVIVFAVTSVAALHGRWRRRLSLGLGVRNGALRDVAAGLVIGAAGMGMTGTLVLASGSARIRGVHLDAALLGLGLGAFAGAAVLEEVVYRALVLNGLVRLTGRVMLALAVSSAVFGIVHVTGSPHASAVSVLSDAMGGLMYGAAFLRTRRIWLPVGIHFAWNFAEASLLGFPTSDNATFSGAVAQVAIGGPQWLSGGGFGPEGSVLSLIGRLAIIGMVLLWTRDRRADPDPSPAPVTSPLSPTSESARSAVATARRPGRGVGRPSSPD